MYRYLQQFFKDGGALLPPSLSLQPGGQAAPQLPQPVRWPASPAGQLAGAPPAAGPVRHAYGRVQAAGPLVEQARLVVVALPLQVCRVPLAHALQKHSRSETLYLFYECVQKKSKIFCFSSIGIFFLILNHIRYIFITVPLSKINKIKDELFI